MDTTPLNRSLSRSFLGPLAVGLATLSLAGCADSDLAPEVLERGREVEMPQLDQNLAPLSVSDCAWSATGNRVTWQIRAGTPVVLRQAAGAKIVTVNGVHCVPTGSAPKTMTLKVASGSNLTLDYGFGGAVFLPGSATTVGVSIEAVGAYELSVRGTVGNNAITAGSTGLTFNGDKFRDVAWNRNPSTLRVSAEAGNDNVSGLGSPATGAIYPGPMRIFGGDGDDTLSGGNASDHLEGGAGADNFRTAPKADGADTYLGGDGADEMTYAGTTVDGMRLHDGRWHESLGDPVSACLGKLPLRRAATDGRPCDVTKPDARGHFGVLVVTGAWYDGDAGLWNPVTMPQAATEAQRCASQASTRYDARLKKDVPFRTWTLSEAVARDESRLTRRSGRILSISDPVCAARFARGGAHPDAVRDDPQAQWCLGSLVTEGDVFDSVESVTGTNGIDVMYAGTCEGTTFFGLNGDDVLYAGAGGEGGRLDGGNGDDLLLFGLGVPAGAGANGATTYVGGPGTDMVLCSACETGLTVSIDGKANDGFRAEGGFMRGYVSRSPCRRLRGVGVDADDVENDVEVVEGTVADDMIIVSTGSKMVGGGTYGKDLLIGGTQRDLLYAGALVEGALLPITPEPTGFPRVIRSWAARYAHFQGSVPAWPTAVAYAIPRTRTSETLTGQTVLCGADGHDTLVGSSGDDYLYGGRNDDVLLGYEGDDILQASLGQDWVDGGAGDDVMGGSTGADLVFCGEGDGDRGGIDRSDVICTKAADATQTYIGGGWWRLPVLASLCGTTPPGAQPDKRLRLSLYPALHRCEGPRPTAADYAGPPPTYVEETPPPVCAPECVNGTCAAGNRCTCDEGWKGPTCAVPVCSPACGAGTSCVAPNTCEAGVVCEPDQCEVSSTLSGDECFIVPKAFGTTCDDEDLGTRTDRCDGAGDCVGTPIVCTPGPCHVSSTPNGTDCTIVRKATGSTCDDGKAGTDNDRCTDAGACKGQGMPFTVTYDLEGGPGSCDPFIATYDAPYGPLCVPAARAGWSFEGWFDGDNGTGNEVRADTAVGIADNHTLYARWHIVYVPGPAGEYARLVVAADGLGKLCPGATREVEYEIVGTFTPGNQFVLEMSDAAGAFGTPTRVGLFQSAVAGRIAFTVPADATGDGYRLRIVSSRPFTKGPASSATFGVHTKPDASFTSAPSAILEGGTVTLTAANQTYPTYLWNLGAGASPLASAAKSVQVRYATAGQKNPSLTVTDANGCSSTATSQRVEVVGCRGQIPNGAAVVDFANRSGAGSADAAWVCPGGATSGSVRSTAVFIESGATASMSYRSGGVHYVKSGGTLTGSAASGAIIVYETGATIPESGTRLLCPSVELDRTQAPTPGCVPASDSVASLAPGAAALGTLCAGASGSVPYQVSGPFGANNRFTVQLSDATGSFANPSNIGSVASAAAGTISFNLPSSVSGEGFRLRVVSSQPFVVGPASPDSFRINARPDATFAMSTRTLGDSGQTTRLTATNAALASYSWSLGAGASPATATTPEVDVSYATAGAKTVTLTVADANGCTASWSPSTPVTVYTCSPAITGAVSVVDFAASSVSSSADAAWVCPGGTTSSSILNNQSVFVENAGSAAASERAGAINYVKSGGTLRGRSHITSTVAVHEPGAIFSDFNGLKVECPVVAINRSAAPFPGCTTEAGPTVALASGAAALGTVCAGTSTSIAYTTTGNFASNNRFTLQLSNAEGSFASPTNVGQVTSAAAGSITFAIPPSASGAAYRLRIVASQPYVVSESPADTFRINPRPNAGFTVSKRLLLLNEETTFLADDLTLASYHWAFGAGAALPNATGLMGTTSYTTAGTKTPSLTVTDADGCSATWTLPQSGANRVAVFSCQPQARGTVIDYATSQIPSTSPLWLCPGGSVTSNARFYEVFVENQGLTITSQRDYAVFYLRSGATLRAASGSNWSGSHPVAVYEEGAIFENYTGPKVLCPALTFDYTQAPVPGCF